MDTTPPPVPPPQVGLDPAGAVPLSYATAPAGPFALYSPGAVGLATFLGAPIAGTVIMAMNYRRLGKPASAIKAIVAGLIATIALLALGFLLPDHSPSYLLGIIPVIVMAQLAKVYQGRVFESHQAAGGGVASMWKATGIGLLSLILILAIVFGIVFLGIFATTHSNGTRMAFGNSEIFYSGSATAADAQALGKALTDDGYFAAGHTTSVLLSKDSSGTMLRFVVNEDAGKKPETLDTFATITDQISPAVGGKPITVKLVNPELKELQSRKVQ